MRYPFCSRPDGVWPDGPSRPIFLALKPSPAVVQSPRTYAPRWGRGLLLKASNLRAVLTDSHFWVPALVLAVGIVLLVLLH